MTEIMLKRR